MAKLWAVVQREYLERVQTTWFVISTVLGPVLFATMLFLPAWLASRNTAGKNTADIVILDATGAGLGERVRVALGTAGSTVRDAAITGNTQVRVVGPGGLAAAESAAVRDVVEKRTQGYLVLDGRALRGDSANYSGRNATSVSDTRRLEAAVRQAVLAAHLEGEGLDPARIDSITRPRLRLGTERLSERGRSGSGQANVIFAVGVSFLLYTSILLYGQNVLRSVIEEKQTRVAEVVISSIRPETLLAGKVIGVGAVGLTQQIVWLGSTLYIGSLLAPFLLRMNAAPASGSATTAVPVVGAGSAAAALPMVPLGSVALILAFFLLGYLFYSSLYAAVGSTVNSEQEAQQAVGPIIVLIVASAVLIQPVMMNPSGGVARAGSLIPFSAPIIMPLRMSLVNVPPSDLAISVGGLMLACVAALWLAARIYRVGLLMYGKRPTLTELVRWVRYAG